MYIYIYIYVTTQTSTSEFRARSTCSYQVYPNTNTNQQKLKVLIKNLFLYSSLFPCIKAIIYKIRKTLKLHFILKFARLQLGCNLRYSSKYYIAKRLAKLLFTNLTPKT